MNYRRYNPNDDSLEMRLLLGCYRRVLCTLSEAEWQALLTQMHTVDIARFLDITHYHRAELLVQNTLVKPYKKELPLHLVQPLTQAAQTITYQQLALTRCALTVHKTLSQQGIAHCYLKGPALSYALGGTQPLRYSADLDLVVAHRDLLRVDACLRTLHFVPSTPFTHIQRYTRQGASFTKDIHYFSQTSEAVIEVHWKTHLYELLLNTDTPNWQQAIVTSDGLHLPVLNDYDNAIYLCFHAAKHHWQRLRWLLDVAEWMRLKQLDWATLLQQAESHHVGPAILQTAFLLQTWFGVNCGLEHVYSDEEHKALQRQIEKRTQWIHHKKTLTRWNGINFFVQTAYRHFFLNYQLGHLVSGRWRAWRLRMVMLLQVIPTIASDKTKPFTIWLFRRWQAARRAASQ